MLNLEAACCTLPTVIHRLTNTPTSEERRASLETARIDQQLEVERRQMRKVMRLLLLGPSEAGKSTIVKQMRILHANGFTEGEYLVNKYMIYTDLVKSAVIQADTFLAKGGQFSDPVYYKFQDKLEMIRRATKSQNTDDIYEMKPWLANAMKYLLTDEFFGEYVAKYGHTNVDASSYFLDDIDRITGDSFVPIEADFLHLRVSTTGIVEIAFKLKGFDFRVVDVGGQKTERKKWLHAFENVNAVIFMCALSDFNLVLREDGYTSRLADAIELFREMYTSLWFHNASFLVFFNKKDLLEEKLKTLQLKDFVECYQGDNSYEDAATFLESLFFDSVCDAPNLPKQRNRFTHRTCATDTNQMELVLGNCIDIVLEQNMKSTGLT